MPATSNQDTTELLSKWNQGDQTAYDALVTRVYTDLKRVARKLLSAEGLSSLQPTVLVNEAYLRLVDQQRATIHDRRHFITIAANSMRRVIIDHARSRATHRRGKGYRNVPFDEAWNVPENRESLLLEVEDALSDMAKNSPELVAIVEQKFFVGLPLAEIAELAGVSTMTIRRKWGLAKEALNQALAKGQQR